MAAFNGVRVFSATLFRDRDQLGERVTAWIASHPNVQITDLVVTQSSDSEFHLIAITLFYLEDLPAGAALRQASSRSS